MNLQSEIAYYTEIRIADKARLMRVSCRSSRPRREPRTATSGLGGDAARLRFTNEMCNRITKLIEQYLGDDKTRPTTWCCARCFHAPTRSRKMIRAPTGAAELRAI
jgi:hypothetical protein